LLHLPIHAPLAPQGWAAGVGGVLMQVVTPRKENVKKWRYEYENSYNTVILL
jgi:hypothetical protein